MQRHSSTGDRDGDPPSVRILVLILLITTIVTITTIIGEVTVTVTVRAMYGNTVMQ